jgi:hypothetical protein
VLDDAGDPITNAWVHGTGYWRPAKSEGVTDGNGYFSYEDRVFGDIACRAEKTGYYGADGEVWPGPRVFGEHPTNALVVVLKRVINPVPMAFHRIATELPKLGVPVAFDVGVGDWTAPHGKGVERDMWFTGARTGVSRQDHDARVTIVFSNSVDGIQAFTAPHPRKIPLASDLMPPQQAPLAGYTNRIALWQSWHPGGSFVSSDRENQNYIFRVRASTNATGGIRQANVGWVQEDIGVDLGEGQGVFVMFNYYYNPDPQSRSLEPAEAQ